jgi:HEAT repeat protein
MTCRQENTKIERRTWYRMNQNEVWSFVHTIDQSHLAEGLKNNDKRVRKLTTQRIGVMRDPSEIPHLIEVLAQERDAYIESQIINALTRMGEPAIPPLIQGLTIGNENLRCASAKGLGGIGCVVAIKNLCAAAGDESPLVRRAAVQALGSIGILNDEVEATVLTCLQDTDRGVVINAAFASGDLGCSAAVPRLLSLLDEINNYNQRYIIRVLGQIGDTCATEKLCKLLVKNDGQGNAKVTLETSERGEELVEALGKIADPRAVQPIIQVLIHSITTDNDNQECDTEDGCTPSCSDEFKRARPSDIAANIHRALVQIGEPAIPPLIDTLRAWADKEEDNEDCTGCYPRRGCSVCIVSVASEISFILSDFGPLGVDAVLKLLDDENVSVRKLAVNFFTEVHLGEKRVMDALIACMINDTEEKVKTLAAYCLVDGGQKSFEAIVSAVDQLHRPFSDREREAIRLIGSEALSNLTWCLNQTDEERRCAVDAFRELIKFSPSQTGMESVSDLSS